MADTYEQSIADYYANSDYDLDNSTAKAKLFIKACRDLIIQLPAEVEKGARGQVEKTKLSPELLENRLTAAQRWYNSKTAGGGTTHFDLTDFRS